MSAVDISIDGGRRPSTGTAENWRRPRSEKKWTVPKRVMSSVLFTEFTESTEFTDFFRIFTPRNSKKRPTVGNFFHVNGDAYPAGFQKPST
jgi:hypothetical protein